jgi:hypothetical protein
MMANMGVSFTVELPEVGPMRVIHGGEDVDLVALPDGRVVPALIGFADSESWEPETYRAALLDAGWEQLTEFASDGSCDHYAQARWVR